jgi:hypothetical protein
MRAAAALLALLLLALLAPTASAGHTFGVVPEGGADVRVLFVVVFVPLPAPTSHVDQLYADACGATQGLPARCTYHRRVCIPQDLEVLCKT